MNVLGFDLLKVGGIQVFRQPAAQFEPLGLIKEGDLALQFGYRVFAGTPRFPHWPQAASIGRSYGDIEVKVLVIKTYFAARRYDPRMGTELVFSGGHSVSVVGTNAETLSRTLNRPASGEEIRLPSGQVLAPGWVDVQTEDLGMILVNPAQVAYVYDVPDREPVLDQAG